MGLGNVLILSQVTFYVLTFIISFFIFIPLTVNQNAFNDHCLLHAQGEWNTSVEGGAKLHISSWGNPGECNFPIFVGVVLFPLSLFYVLWHSVFLFKGTEPSWASAFLSMVVAVIVVVMLLVAAVVLSSGHDAWCRLIEKHMGDCSSADYDAHFLDEKDINPIGVNMEMGMAKFGLWTSLILWILLTVMAATQIYRYHSQEDFFISFHRERERLVQRINPNTQTSYSV